MDLSVTKQCQHLGINRSSAYYKNCSDREEKDIEDLVLLLEVLKEIPFYGCRKVSRKLMDEHPHLTKKRVKENHEKIWIENYIYQTKSIKETECGQAILRISK